MPIHPNETEMDMTLAAVIKRHTPYQMSGREWGDTRVEYVWYCPECACRAIECDVAVVLAEVARLRAALVEERAINLASVVVAHIPSEKGRAAARAELVAEGLLPPA